MVSQKTSCQDPIFWHTYQLKKLMIFSWVEVLKCIKESLIRSKDVKLEVKVLETSAYFYIRNLYCGHLELDEYDDISKSRRDHGSKCASLDVKETESGQGSGAFNFLKDRKPFSRIWWLNSCIRTCLANMKYYYEFEHKKGSLWFFHIVPKHL